MEQLPLLPSPYYKTDAYARRKSNSDNTNICKDETEFISVGMRDIEVKLLYMADISGADLQLALAKMVNATRDSHLDRPVNEYVEEMYVGGLRHGLNEINMVFEIKGVSRATTHQIVRHRKWGFHQQGMRWTYFTEGTLGFRIAESIAANPELFDEVLHYLDHSERMYRRLYDADIPIQDCRDMLPIGTKTYIIAETNLLEFMNTFAYRGCSVMQQQTVYIFWEMRKRIIEKYPWLDKHIKLSCEKARYCTHQGWETTADSCNLEWARDKRFTSDIFSKK